MYKILLGNITDVNSKEYTCHIKAFDPETNRGYILENVPFLSRSQSSDSWAGSTEIPERLSPCLVIDINGQYYILDTVPPKHALIGDEFEADKNISLTQTIESYTPDYEKSIKQKGQVTKRKFLIGARGHRPHDSLPGDKFWRTREGSFFGLLRGGVIIARVHEFCQFMLNRIDGLGRLVVRNLQMFTDWGRLDILNDKGKTNLSLNVGESYSNNKQEKFTIHLDVGKEGNLVHLRITDTGGTEMSRIQLFPNGRVEVESQHSIYLKRKGSVVDLNNSGDINITSEKDLNITASNDMTILAKRDLSITALRNSNMSLGGSRFGMDSDGNVYVTAANTLYLEGSTIQHNGGNDINWLNSMQVLYEGTYISLGAYIDARIAAAPP